MNNSDERKKNERKKRQMYSFTPMKCAVGIYFVN